MAALFLPMKLLRDIYPILAKGLVYAADDICSSVLHLKKVDILLKVY